ncbi:Hpt domain-containing protein [Thermodesulfobacteriota bacterium]
MSFNNDEALQVFIDEALEHLADIENDLLAIEKDGVNLNDELINKVFRGAHSIKGGAGFLRLQNIKELSHKMENLLGKIRNRKIIPNAENINILLLASDALRNMVDDVANSNETDISTYLEAIDEIVIAGEPAQEPVKTEIHPQEPGEAVQVEFSASESAPTTPEKPLIPPKTESVPPITDSVEMQALDDESLQVFIDESLEHLADIESDLLAIEKDGANLNDELINKVFRGAHSIKGGAGFLRLNNIQELSHKMENLLGKIRNRKIIPNAENINILLLASDALRNMIDDVAGSNETDISTYLEAIDEIVIAGEPAQEPRKAEIHPPEPGEEKRVERPTIDSTPIPTEQPRTPVKTHIESPAGESKEIKAPGFDSTLRVNIKILDSLMNLAGELVLSRNQLLQAIKSGDSRGTERVGQRVDLITSELQEAIMLTRMQSIGNVFTRFPRLVRDLIRDIGKEVELIIEGKDVELDKSIIEAINEPLTHLIRNSIDHGIEKPEERLVVGKDPKGSIILKAFHEAGQVIIEVSDDGKGIDGNALAAAAIAKNIVSESQVRLMSEKEKMYLIFQPGFSTAEIVTEVSGRGVGMDVVKTNLDKLGGQIEIFSQLGEGTTIRIKLPLTLAIISSQVVYDSGERYAIPQVNLDELIRIPAAQIKNRIEKVGNAEVLRLRGNLLPIVRLKDLIGVEKDYVDPSEGIRKTDRRNNIADRRSKTSPLFTEEGVDNGNYSSFGNDLQQRQDIERRTNPVSALNIVVVSTGVIKYGLLVDELLDSEEIVVKPLGMHIKKCSTYAGTTIMGDGRVALILDVANIAKTANLTSLEGSDRARELALELAEDYKIIHDYQSLLIFYSARDEQLAVPLEQVVRIEKIKADTIEIKGGRRVIKYRGATLALFSLDEVADVKPLAEQNNLLVIIFNVSGREVGLLAIEPINSKEISIGIDDTILKQTGIIGSATIDEKITQIIHVNQLFQTLLPDWFPKREVQAAASGSRTVLLAEDSTFFRNQVREFIQGEGYHVIEAEDGLIAWEILQSQYDEISLVVTDIEMPNLDGFGLSERIKSNDRYKHIPIIALTTLASEESFARGKEVGIDTYHIKLDKDELLKSVQTYLGGNSG